MKVSTESYVTSQAMVLDVAPGSGKRLFECKDSESETGYSLIAKIACTFSGIITNNLNMYRPDKMKESAWMVGNKYGNNIGLPLLFGHDRSRPAIGRFIHSYYVDTSADYLRLDKNIAKFVSSSEELDTEQVLHVARKIAKYQLGKQGGKFRGLGHTIGIARITSEDDIRRVLDERFFNVSTHQKTDYAACVICGAPKIGNAPTCEHEPGDVVDGIPVFHVWNIMTYGEVSTVNVPAMPFARITDSKIVRGDHTKQSIVNIATGWAETGDALYIKRDGSTEIELFSGVADSAAEQEITSLIEEKDNMKLRVISKFIDNVKALLGSDSEISIAEDGTLNVGIDKVKEAIGDKFDETWFEEVKDAGDEQQNEANTSEKETTDEEKPEDTTTEDSSNDDPVDSEQNDSRKGIASADVSDAIASDERTEDDIDSAEVYNEMLKEMESDELSEIVTDETKEWQVALKHFYMPDGELDEESEDAKLSADKRKKLKSSTFCGPNKSFPVPDCAHVTAALRLLGRYKGPGSKDSIRSCVMRKAKAMGCNTKKSSDSESKDTERSESLIGIITAWGQASEKDILDLAKYLHNRLSSPDVSATTIEEAGKLLQFVTSEKIQKERDSLWQRLDKAHRIISARDEEIAQLKEEIDVVEDTLHASNDNARKTYCDMIGMVAKLGLVEDIDTGEMDLATLESKVVEVIGKVSEASDEVVDTPTSSTDSGTSDPETAKRNERITRGKLTLAAMKDMLSMGGGIRNTMSVIRDVRR